MNNLGGFVRPTNPSQTQPANNNNELDQTTYDKLKATGLLDIPDGHHVVFIDGCYSSGLANGNQSVTWSIDTLSGHNGMSGNGTANTTFACVVSSLSVSVSAMPDSEEIVTFKNNFATSGILSLSSNYRVVYTSNANPYFLKEKSENVSVSGAAQATGHPVVSTSFLIFKYLAFDNNNPLRPLTNATPVRPSRKISELRAYLRNIGFIQANIVRNLALASSGLTHLNNFPRHVHPQFLARIKNAPGNLVDDVIVDIRHRLNTPQLSHGVNNLSLNNIVLPPSLPQTSDLPAQHERNSSHSQPSVRSQPSQDEGSGWGGWLMGAAVAVVGIAALATAGLFQQQSDQRRVSTNNREDAERNNRRPSDRTNTSSTNNQNTRSQNASDNARSSGSNRTSNASSANNYTSDRANNSNNNNQRSRSQNASDNARSSGSSRTTNASSSTNSTSDRNNRNNNNQSSRAQNVSDNSRSSGLNSTTNASSSSSFSSDRANNRNNNSQSGVSQNASNNPRASNSNSGTGTSRTTSTAHSTRGVSNANTSSISDRANNIANTSTVPVNYSHADLRNTANSSSPSSISSNAITTRDISANTIQCSFDASGPDKLGQGNYGVVYKGIWNNRGVAIKVLNINGGAVDVKQVFEREVELMMQLRHDNIVRFYGVSASREGIPLLVMEYMRKGSLYSLLHGQETVLWPTRIQITIDIGLGLEHLHSKSIIHCDLNSKNVLITNDYHAKLTDFGLSRVKNDISTSSHSRTGGMVGTMPWMAPELFEDGGSVNKRTDMYSFGVTMYELATQAQPFAGMTPAQQLRKITGNEKRETYQPIPPDVPLQFAILLKKCWDKRAERRPTATQAVQELRSTPAQSASSSTRN